LAPGTAAESVGSKIGYVTSVKNENIIISMRRKRRKRYLRSACKPNS
jgi:hypothetical protein